MPFINHDNFGSIQKHVYLTGVISKVYAESDTVNEAYWDTADVLLDDYQYVWEHAKIFYHCYPDATLRVNGSIIDGAKGFSEGDKVVVFAEIITPKIGMQRQVGDVTIIGHRDGPVKCAYNYLLIRCSLNELSELSVDAETANLEEQCIIFDVLLKAPAKIPDPDNPNVNLVFPCSVNKVKHFLRNIDFQGLEMWESFPQGDNEIQIAGGVPNWTSDISGDDIRGSAEASDWWTSYDVNGNPIQNFFEDTCLALMTDDAGASAGTYNKAQAIIDAAESDIKKWESRSSGFVTDSREYPVTGCPDLKLDYAIDPDGFILTPAISSHIQTAYGENEIWMCIVNSYRGIIIEYCDASNKFVRTPRLYDAIPIPGVISNYETVASDAALASVLPGGMSSGKLIGDIGMALAASITLTGKGNENNLFSWATLKRVNEGAYHRTIHPAITGSQVLRSTKIPADTSEEPQYLSAINFRKDIINAWYRYDNWNNTFNYITYSFGVSPTWWFRSLAQQFGCDTIYVDTPIGSMWYQAPNWKGFVYYLYAIQTGQVLMTARQDKALEQDFKYVCKHSHNICCQIYAAQRTSLTLWANKPNIFTLQTAGVNPYDTVPKLDDETLELIRPAVESRVKAERALAITQANDALTKSVDRTIKAYQALTLALQTDKNTTKEMEEINAAVRAEALARQVLSSAMEVENDPIEIPTDSVSYAKLSDSSYKQHELLTSEELESLISDRIFIFSNSVDKSASLRQNRNEIEIMAAVDFYSDLYTEYERRNPADQKRCPELETEIAKLIQAVTTLGESKFLPFYLDMEIL